MMMLLGGRKRPTGAPVSRSEAERGDRLLILDGLKTFGAAFELAGTALSGVTYDPS